MSDVTADSLARKESGMPSAQTGSLCRVRRIGYAVLGLQLACFLVWSTILYQRFALTFDFAINHQAWWQVAQGNLDPYTIEGFAFWQDHSEFILWPLALLYWVWPHGVTLLWLQDLCVVGAEVVAFTWLCDLMGCHRRRRDAAMFATAGLALLAANPWIWWAISFDFHFEAIAVLFAALLARDLANGRRRAWAWVVPLIACGDVAGTYLAGLGMGGMLAGRAMRRRGAVMACLGIVTTLVITLVHGNRGSGGGLHAYAYLAAARPLGAPLSLAALAKGIAAHPLGVLRTLWTKRIDILANLAPAGLVGLGDLLILPLALVVLLANTLFGGLKFAEPIFQYAPVYVLLPVGTVAVLGRLTQRHRRAALAIACLLTAQTLGWAAVWGPRTPSQWLRVSTPAAATLASVEARIPASAEVIASEGVMGRFSGRVHLQALSTPGTRPVQGETWFVITPSQGVEIQSIGSATALIQELAGPMHATLVTDAHGVWAFRWRPPPGLHTITVPGDTAPLSAWAAPMAPGAVGRRVMTGPPGTWRMTSSGGKGYVADEIVWQKPPGRYQALVTLSAADPVKVEVWNDTGNTLLARRSIPATTGVESVVIPVDATSAYHATPYSGWGPFRAEFVSRPEGQQLEVRVWSPGAGTVNVYSANLVGAGRNSSGVMTGS